MRNTLLILLAIAIALAVYFKVKADNKERDLQVTRQNLFAAVDSTRLVYEDSMSGVREHARLASVRAQTEMRLVIQSI